MSTELPKVYAPKETEDKWYQKWIDTKSFSPIQDKEKESFVIIMPPPNVTGILHMGHALDATTQDVLTRFKRMQGFKTLWVPGQDHAGIATQKKVEAQILASEGKTKNELGREEFIKRIWDWKEECGGTILEQQKKLGVSCDWDYFTFTMDEVPNKAVKKTFIKMFNEGLIYQSDYIVNWDPDLQSAISDAEVEHKEVNGKFYNINYKVKGNDKILLEVATTRPETLFGDTAVAVNPNDERFAHLIGQMAIVPICNREIPIIGDEHVDIEKGTGCLKVTPGHDFNDFDIGKRNDLPIINILNKDGTLNNEAHIVEGLTCDEARDKVVQTLKELGAFVSQREHVHQVGHGDRSKAVIEPMVSKQWFLNIEKMAGNSVKSVEDGDMTFYPKGWENTYFSYLRNPRQWCISRQLWWGHQIPVFYCGHDEDHVWASEETPTECPTCKSTNIKQDPDVLDTWFSSGLWPLSSLGWPDEEVMKEKRFDEFYPTGTLVTGFDIIFFWVARMMMMCEEATGQVPFKNTYIHAIVRDKDGIKMSKSLGNIIDPLTVIEEYGCDALRFTLAASSGYNRNINLDPTKIEGYRNFINKLWNAFRFINPFLEVANDNLPAVKDLHHHDKWILGELNDVIKDMTKSFEEYRFDDACSTLYSFVYDIFCSWYVECSKSILYGEDEAAKIQRASVLKYCFREIMKLIHPVTPFISEELWSILKTDEESLLISQTYPTYNEDHVFPDVQENMNKMIEVITAVRNIRQSINLKPKEEIDVRLFTDDIKLAKFFYDAKDDFKALANIKSGTIVPKHSDKPKKSSMMAAGHTDVYIPLDGLIDINDQIARIQKSIDKTQVEFDKISKKLKNKNFMDRAPDNVVVEVREKGSVLQEKLSSLESTLSNFQ
jgi:valyl-tRNA synthetase